MLVAVLEALQKAMTTDHVSDQVKRLIHAVGHKERSSAELMQSLQLSHAPTYRKNYLTPE